MYDKLIQERCDLIANDSRRIDILVGHYYDANPDHPMDIVECNNVRTIVVEQKYLWSVAVDQLTEAGIIPAY